MASIIFDPRRQGIPAETGEGNHLNQLTRETLFAKLISVADEAHLDVGHLYMFKDGELHEAIDSSPAKFAQDPAAKMVMLARQKSLPFPLSALVSRFIYDPLKGEARQAAREWIENEMAERLQADQPLAIKDPRKMTQSAGVRELYSFGSDITRGVPSSVP